jgi:DNA polymerase-3 subunit alpha
LGPWHDKPRLAKEGKPPVDIAAIPIDDKKSFALLQRFETTAVFQLESAA